MQKDGRRVQQQSIDKYIFTLKLLQEFHFKTKFELKLFFVNRLNDNQRKKAREHSQQFYFRFKEFLYCKGYFDNYVGLCIKVLIAFFNYLLNHQQMQIGTFHKNFYVPKEEIPIIALNPQQLNYLIYNRELEHQLPPNLLIAKDIFVVGCSVCLRISDLMNLKPFHLTRAIDLTGKENAYLKVRSKKLNLKQP